MLKIGYTPNIIVSLMMQIERDLLRNSSGIVSDVVVIRRPAQSWESQATVSNVVTLQLYLLIRTYFYLHATSCKSDR